MTTNQSVYVVSGEGWPMKIGMSANPTTRIIGLKSERRYLPKLRVPVAGQLCVLATYPRETGDARIVERVAHKLLWEKRISGEWFDVTKRQAMAAVRNAIRIVDSGDLSMVNTRRLDINPGKDLLAGIDDWRRTQPGVPSRSKAARRLVEMGLTLHGHWPPKRAKCIAPPQPVAATVRPKPVRKRA